MTTAGESDDKHTRRRHAVQLIHPNKAFDSLPTCVALGKAKDLIPKEGVKTL